MNFNKKQELGVWSEMEEKNKEKQARLLSYKQYIGA